MLDSNSVSVNPGFVSTTDLTPSSGAMNNMGTTSLLTLVPDDINGVLRNPAGPDMGAIEFDPIAYEAAHLGFTSPVGGCDAGIEPVTIRLRNLGAMPINGNLTASYRIVGSSTVYTDTVLSIVAPGDTLVYTFNTPINLTVTQDSSFALVSWIRLAGDPITVNDTATVKVGSSVSPPAPQVVNVNIPYGQTATLAVINPDTNNLYYWYDVRLEVLTLRMIHNTPHRHCLTRQCYYVESIYGFGKGSLPTIMSAGNSLGGVMFNLTAINPLTVDSFYVNTATSSMMEVYYKQGTYVGFEQNANAWTLAGSASVVSAGTGNNTLVNIGGIHIPGGQTYGIYLAHTSGSMQYTNGNGANQYYADANLILEAGAGVGYAFASLFSPRVFNGTVHYSSGNGCTSLRVADTVFVSAPTVVVSLGADKSICQGDTTQLNAVVSGGVPPYTYSWSPATSVNNATLPNPLAFPVVNTTYSVTVTDQNSDSGTDDIIVTVVPAPNVTFTPVPGIHINTPSFPLTTGLPAGGTYSGRVSQAVSLIQLLPVEVPIP
jgi:hypothetical protein